MQYQVILVLLGLGILSAANGARQSCTSTLTSKEAFSCVTEDLSPQKFHRRDAQLHVAYKQESGKLGVALSLPEGYWFHSKVNAKFSVDRQMSGGSRVKEMASGRPQEMTLMVDPEQLTTVAKNTTCCGSVIKIYVRAHVCKLARLDSSHKCRSVQFHRKTSVKCIEPCQGMDGKLIRGGEHGEMCPKCHDEGGTLKNVKREDVETYMVEDDGAVVLGCNAREVFISQTQPWAHKVGSVFIHDDEEEAERCNECARLVRTLEGVEAADSWEGIRCPKGTSCAVLTAHKTHAREFLRPEVLTELGFDADYDFDLQKVHDLPRHCHSNSTSSKTFAGQAAHRQKLAFPKQCESGWLRNSANECPFNACPVSSGCYFCGKAGCNNGCGASFQGASPPDRVRGVFDFRDSCCHHDLCYSAGGVFSQGECDDEFLSDMLRSCRSIFFLRRPVCIVSAYTYFAAVDAFGSRAFTPSVQKQREFLQNGCSL